jgi:hypothetical protein
MNLPLKRMMNLIKITAITVRDILNDIDSRTLDKASGCSAGLHKFDPKTATLDFMTRCPNSKNIWSQRVQLIDFNYVVPEEERPNITTWDQLRTEYPEILEGDVLVHCGCPAYTYWGMSYIMTQLDTALAPENRYPSIRNPSLEGTVCKHLLTVFRNFWH